MYGRTRCVQGIFGREITRYTVIYGVSVCTVIFGVYKVLSAGKSPDIRSYTVLVYVRPYTMYIRSYTVTKYMVIDGAYIRLMANPRNDAVLAFGCSAHCAVLFARTAADALVSQYTAHTDSHTRAHTHTRTHTHEHTPHTHMSTHT